MSAFREAVEQQLEGIDHLSPGVVEDCSECNIPEGLSDEERQMYEEPSFSRSPCDGCGSTFGGDRHPVHGFATWSGKQHLIHLDVCVDCIMFIANGEEPEEWTKYP